MTRAAVRPAWLPDAEAIDAQASVPAELADAPPSAALTRAFKAQYELGEISGYIDGVRAGRLAGLGWGTLLGALAAALAVYLGTTSPTP